jgi:hypothetical protein
MCSSVSIRQDILGQERAGYGERFIGEMGEHLTAEYGREFGYLYLFRMIWFAELCPDSDDIVVTIRVVTRR